MFQLFQAIIWAMSAQQKVFDFLHFYCMYFGSNDQGFYKKYYKVKYQIIKLQSLIFYFFFVLKRFDTELHQRWCIVQNSLC